MSPKHLSRNCENGLKQNHNSNLLDVVAFQNNFFEIFWFIPLIILLKYNDVNQAAPVTPGRIKIQDLYEYVIVLCLYGTTWSEIFLFLVKKV